MFLTVVFCAGMTIPVCAENVSYKIDNEIELAYEIAQNPIASLAISGTTATCVSSTTGTSTTKITVTHTLQKYSGLFWIWNDVENATWTKTANTNTIRLSTTKSGLLSGTYRLKSVFTLTNSSGETETVTVYSDEKAVS